MGLGGWPGFLGAAEAAFASQLPCARALFAHAAAASVVPAALLALKDRLARLDLRAGGGGGAASLAHLWRCPPGEHLTAMCVPSCAAPAPAAAAASGLGGGAWEHLLAAAAAGGPGASTRLLLFDLRRPGEPAAAWEQPPFDGRLSEEAALLRWLPAAGSGAAGGGAVLAGACSSGRVSAGQFSPQVGLALAAQPCCLPR